MSYDKDKRLPKKSAVVATTTTKNGKIVVSTLHLVNGAGIVECGCHITPRQSIFVEDMKMTEVIRSMLCTTHKYRRLQSEGNNQLAGRDRQQDRQGGA